MLKICKHNCYFFNFQGGEGEEQERGRGRGGGGAGVGVEGENGDTVMGCGRGEWLSGCQCRLTSERRVASGACRGRPTAGPTRKPAN